MSDGGSNRLPYNPSQRSSQPQHRQQQQQQQQQPLQHTAAAQQMGGYMMHQQPTWGGGSGVQQAQYGQAQQQQQQQQSIYQQQLYQQHMQQQQPTDFGGVTAAAAASAGGILPQYHQALMAMGPQGAYNMNQQQAVVPPQPMQVLQPRPGRLPADRPIMKLSVGLIETYKEINKTYYEEREARKQARKAKAASKQGGGTQNNGWDDDNFDYIFTPNEIIDNRYKLIKRIGKGSFGQVVKAIDMQTDKEVAIKIIKSKKPFLLQARTEIALLLQLKDNDPEDEHHIVKLLTTFMHKNHQCLVFEMLAINLYELLKNTNFRGVSLSLIRKFARQILKALAYLAQPHIDIIHCDLKPENILLRSPKRSGIKVIDFGSSCKSTERMYSYIQSRFYRSPEVILGLPYSVAIDMWSLGCILVEMHTGDPLFSGTDQFDQMQKIVQILGMVPNDMLKRADQQNRSQFFEKQGGSWTIRQTSDASQTRPSSPIIPSQNPIASLKGVFANKQEPERAQDYDNFVDMIFRMLTYDPKRRIRPEEALQHPFITNVPPEP